MPSFPYKILGKLSDADGVGVFGHNTASSGETKGVEGAVDSPDGYGLYTDDDAYVGGSADVEQIWDEKQARGLVTGGSGTEADPYTLPDGILDGYWGVLRFQGGWYAAELATDPAIDREERANWFRGDGIRSTTLHHPSDAPDTPTITILDDTGNTNFGGVTDMSVYGAGRSDTSGSAHIVHGAANGNLIDLEFRNVIIRYGGGDALHIDGAASGTRVQNAWLENVEGSGLHLGAGGTRAKVSNVHIIGTGATGVHTKAARSSYHGLSIWSVDGRGINANSGNSQWSNLFVGGTAGNAIDIRAASQSFTNIRIDDIDAESAVHWTDGANNTTLSNAVFSDIGTSSWNRCIRLFADGCSINNVVAANTTSSTGHVLLKIEGGSNNHISNIGSPDRDMEVIISAGSTENIIDGLWGVPWSNVTDNGTRTVINGYGTNEGDPTRTGEWNGHAAYAGEMGLTVWDTTTSPWTQYTATPDGEWT